MQIFLFIFILLMFIFTEKITAQEKKTKEDVFVSVHELPQFPGGADEMYAFIKKTLILPEKCVTDSTFKHAIVFVKFIVEEDGKLSNPEIIKGSTAFPECDKEALRIVSIMPRWNPGMQDHKPVKKSYSLHVTFKKSNS